MAKKKKYKPINLPTYAGGGKVGDTFKIAGDTLLSTLGLTDVINDDMYKNQGFANASRIGETIGGYAGKIAGNILLPGMGGAAVGTAQKMLGNVDGEDEYRQHLDEISSLKSQGELGKFNNAAYGLPQNLNQIQGITTGLGELGTNFSANGIQGMQDQFGNMKQQVNNFQLPTFSNGGGLLDYSKQILNQAQPFTDSLNNPIVSGGANNLSILDSIKFATRMNQYNKTMSGIAGSEYDRMGLLEPRKQQYTTPQFAAGGDFIEYDGASHEQGGIPIDANGQPIAVAEVEGDETMAKIENPTTDEIDKYIFSDRLMQDPKSKTTFADTSKKINRKYKDAETDKFQKDARDLELGRLKEEQEAFKQTIAGNQQHQMPNGQMMNNNMMATGGPLKPIQEQNFDDFYLENSPYNTFVNTKQGFIPYSPEYLDANPLIENPNANINVPDSPLEQDNTIYDPTTSEPYQLGSFKSGVETFGNGTGVNGNYKSAEQPLAEGQLPQDKINPLGYAASNIGNVYDLFQSAKPAKANKFATPTLQGINLDAQRKELEKQSGLSTALNRENVRQLATSSGQALGNQIVGNALINSSLGSGLSQSFLNEITANTETANKQSMINADTRNQEIVADQMDLAKRQSTTSQALHGIGSNTQGYARDLKSAKVGNENNKLWFDAIKNGKYVNLGMDANNNMVIKLPDGRIVSKQS